ncbi:MAG: apolipoprotein N-acyltransferase [Bacillota bacterium]
MIIFPILIITFLIILPFYFPNLFFLSFFSFTPILYIINKSKIKDSFFHGWLFGLIYISLSSYWLIYPLKNFSGLPIIISIFFLLILFSLIAIFYGLWAYILKKVGVGAVRAALTWTAIEYLRYKILSIFPIAYLGYTQQSFKTLLQWADIGGVFLISFFIILINGYLFKLIYFNRKKFIFPILIIFIIISSYGIYRINEFNNLDYNNNFKVGIVQSNIKQENKWNTDMIEKNINNIFSTFDEMENIDLLITPETALTFDIIRNEYYRKKVLKLMENSSTHFQLGAQAIKDNKDNNKYNSSFLFSSDGKILERYNKNRLVPFGEKIPFNNIVNYITNKRWNSLKAGESSPFFKINNIKWKNYICSEILYPNLDSNLSEFDFIVNQSNEAWFGSGLQKQMWAAAIYRAVENRKSVVKAGNYAFSGVILPSGKIKKMEEVTSDKGIKTEIVFNQSNTFYNKYGNYVGYISLIVVIVLLLINFIRIKSRRSEKDEKKEI